MVTRVQTEEEQRATKIQTYAEALDFFIKNPEAIRDPFLKVFIDHLKEMVEHERGKQAKDPGKQKSLYNAPKELQRKIF